MEIDGYKPQPIEYIERGKLWSTKAYFFAGLDISVYTWRFCFDEK